MFAQLQRLTPLAARAKALEFEHAELITLLSRQNGNVSSAPALVPQVHRPSGGTRRGARGGLRIEVSLPKNGKLVLEEVTATETLTVLMERLLLEFGVEGLEKLQAVRTGRGPLLSRSPQRDFLNPKSGQPYTHHRIPGSDLYVITQSSNPEKVTHIERALTLLGLQRNAFQVLLRRD